MCSFTYTHICIVLRSRNRNRKITNHLSTNDQGETIDGRGERERNGEMATWWDGLQISTFGAFSSVCVCALRSFSSLFPVLQISSFLLFVFLFYFLFFLCFCFKFLHLINIINCFSFFFSWRPQRSCLCLPSSEIESNSYINRKPFKNQSLKNSTNHRPFQIQMYYEQSFYQGPRKNLHALFFDFGYRKTGV